MFHVRVGQQSLVYTVSVVMILVYFGISGTAFLTLFSAERFLT